MVKHRIVAEGILAEITSGRLVVGERIASVAELCQEYGVSVGTADKAIVNLAAMGYVERTQGRGTFVREQGAVGQNDRVADSIALISSRDCSDEGHFNWKFLHSVTVEAEKNGYHVVLCTLSDGEDYCAPLIIRSKYALGSLVFDDLSEHQARVLLGHELPHLFVGNHRRTFGHPSIRYDMTDAGYQITGELLALDRGPVWLVIDPTVLVYYGQELLDGYQKALLEGSNPDYLVHIADARDGLGGYVRLARRIAATGQEQFCMIVNCNHLTGLLEQLAEAGVRSDGATIVGVGNIEHSRPHLDRVCLCEQSPEQLAAESVRQIIAGANNGSSMLGKSYKLHIETVDDQVKPLRFWWS